MRKISLIGTFLILAVYLVIASYFGYGEDQVTEEWVARYNGPDNKSDIPKDIAVDSSGNVYVTGYSYGIGISTDYVTIKYDTNGNELWVARYNGPGNGGDMPTAMVIDSSGNVYITGYSYGIGTYNDYATIKYDTNGNELWVARYAGPGMKSDVARAIALDSSGNVFVTGYPCTIKYDNNGNELWVIQNGPEPEEASFQEIAIDSSGNVYATGWCSNWSGGDEGKFGTIKLDNNGNKLWFAVWDYEWYEIAYAIAVDSSGNVFVSGWGYWYSATIKYDSNGNQKWIDFKQCPVDMYPYGMELDSSGDLYVTGQPGTVKYDTNGNEQWFVPYNPEAGFTEPYDMTIAFGGIYLTGQGFQDFVTVKYDLSGNQQWIKWYNGPGDRFESAEHIAIDTQGNVYVTGNSPNESGSSDFCTIKYSQQLTSEEKIYGLIDEVDRLVYEGKIAPGKKDIGMIKKLNEALDTLERGNERAACNKLHDFIDQVNAAINSDPLTQEEGQELIDAANALIDELCGE